VYTSPALLRSRGKQPEALEEEEEEESGRGEVEGVKPSWKRKGVALSVGMLYIRSFRRDKRKAGQT